MSDTFQIGYLTDVPVPQGGVALVWGIANLPAKVSRDMGNRKSITISRDIGPLSSDMVHLVGGFVHPQ